jgi:hypothetical protein
VHGEVDEMLNAWVLRWEAWFGEAFAIEKCGVSETLGDLVDILEVFWGHLV